jgi:hypothetical protein
VLEEVGEAAPAGALVGGADVVPDVDRDLGRPVILAEDDPEPVGQGELGVGDARFCGGEGARSGEEQEAGDDDGSGSHERGSTAPCGGDGRGTPGRIQRAGK